MADFEDANSPTWENLVTGHVNLRDAIEGTISYDSADGREYALEHEPATLLVRPRGWHLPSAHLLVDGEPVGRALFDFGLYFFHSGGAAARGGPGPTSICPSSRATWRRACGTRSSSFARTPSAYRAGRSAPPC